MKSRLRKLHFEYMLVRSIGRAERPPVGHNVKVGGASTSLASAELTAGLAGVEIVFAMRTLRLCALVLPLRLHKTPRAVLLLGHEILAK